MTIQHKDISIYEYVMATGIMVLIPFQISAWELLLFEIISIDLAITISAGSLLGVGTGVLIVISIMIGIDLMRKK